MNLTTVYEDDNIKVELPPQLVKIFNETINEFFTLSKDDTEIMLRKSTDYVEERHPNLLRGIKGAVTSSDVPRLHRHKIFELSNYGTLFEDAVLLLSEYFDMTKGKVTSSWKSQIEEIIYNHYQLAYNTPCILHVFEENYKEVSGFMAVIKNELAIFYYFSLNEDDIFYTFPM